MKSWTWKLKMTWEREWKTTQKKKGWKNLGTTCKESSSAVEWATTPTGKIRPPIGKFLNRAAGTVLNHAIDGKSHVMKRPKIGCWLTSPPCSGLESALESCRFWLWCFPCWCTAKSYEQKNTWTDISCASSSQRLCTTILNMSRMLNRTENFPIRNTGHNMHKLQCCTYKEKFDWTSDSIVLRK